MAVRFVLLSAVAGLAMGCTSLHVLSHVPLSTMQRLWSFDVMSLQTDVFRIGARLPDTLQPREVKVTIDVKRDGDRRRVELDLVAEDIQTELAQLRRYEKKGFRVFIYRASAADVARIETLRAEMIAGQKGEGPARGASGQISVGVKACRTGELGVGPLPTTTLMRTDTSGYFVLVDDLDLRSVISPDLLEKEVPKC